MLRDILKRLFDFQTLTRNEAKDILINITKDVYNKSEVVAFVTVFMMRKVTVDELSGFRDALLELRIPVDLSDYITIDMCGTGGDGKHTFNISTLASLVVAGAGQKVSKHGNYGVSSSCGSSNVMEHFGYKFTNDESKLKKQLDKAGICFLHAPMFHPAMKAIAPIRRELGLKTFFNMLGPMVNPSSPQNQLVGVFDLELARLYNYIYQNGDKNYVILHSLDGYDEISLTSPFKAIFRNGEQMMIAADLKMKQIRQEDIFGGNSVPEAAQIFTSILEGKGTEAQNNVVIANAALALQCIDSSKTIDSCLEEATDSLLEGKAKKSLKTLLEI
ncbi:MAG: anthranilate phosphoribosyltransferase [Marinilabiliaceae bacterium]|nr:anthranilate phosphoribosyltransferase [Marinilabiliaceae bacterium]